MAGQKNVVSILSFLLAAVLLFAGATPAGAASTAEIQELIDALEREESQLSERMDELEGKLEENYNQIEEIIARKETIDQQVFLLNESIASTEEQISAYACLIANKQEELVAAQQRLAQLNEKHKTRIRAMEEEGKLSYWAVLFRASSFSDFLDRLDMVKEIAAADHRRLQQIDAAAKEVAAAQKALETEKAALEQTRQDQQKTQTALEEKRSEADMLLQELLERGTEYELLLEEAERKQDDLMQQLAQREEEYNEAAYQQWLATQKPPTEAQAPSSEIPTDSTKWLTPVSSYRLSSPFGMRPHPILNVKRMHNGVDMACPEGTPIYASRSGVVSVASYQENGAGNYVQLNHGDGYRSIYMHMTHYIVSVGQYVQAGQVIGYVGSTGLSKGNHLHFGISYNGTYVNPMELLG